MCVVGRTHVCRVCGRTHPKESAEVGGARGQHHLVGRVRVAIAGHRHIHKVLLVPQRLEGRHYLDRVVVPAQRVVLFRPHGELRAPRDNAAAAAAAAASAVVSRCCGVVRAAPPTFIYLPSSSPSPPPPPPAAAAPPAAACCCPAARPAAGTLPTWHHHPHTCGRHHPLVWHLSLAQPHTFTLN